MVHQFATYTFSDNDSAPAAAGAAPAAPRRARRPKAWDGFRHVGVNMGLNGQLIWRISCAECSNTKRGRKLGTRRISYVFLCQLAISWAAGRCADDSRLSVYS